MQTAACFGDSLVYGFPFGPGVSWLAVVEELTGQRFLNYGVCGDCTDDIYYRLRTMFLPSDAAHIIFFGGANDLLQRRPQKFILEDLQKAVEFCAARGLELCIVLPLLSSDSVLNERLAPLRSAISSRFAAKVLLLDLQPAVGLSADARAAAYVDGVHPTPATYTAMGKYAAPLLQNWLQQNNSQ